MSVSSLTLSAGTGTPGTSKNQRPISPSVTDLTALGRLPGLPRISRADIAAFLLDAASQARGPSAPRYHRCLDARLAVGEASASSGVLSRRPTAPMPAAISAGCLAAVDHGRHAG
ncbi:hypothetical protein [Streptomyces canus]|uniref:hypothetical protein n=1 Tax=Streptomyces canus TaxID=58343 RepID=UPI00324771A2